MKSIPLLLALTAVIPAVLWSAESPPLLPEVDDAHLAVLDSLPVIHDPEVIDGDTIRGDIDLQWGITLRNETIRAADFDAWETSRRRRSVRLAEDEVERGRRAKEYLSGLANGCEIVLVPGDEPRGVYGRILAKWYLRTDAGHLVSIADLMRDGGHVRINE